MLLDAIQVSRVSGKTPVASALNVYHFRSRAALRNTAMISDCPLNPEHRNFKTQFVSLTTQLYSKWLNGFLHVLRKYIHDLFNVFRRKWLNLLHTDFKLAKNFD